MKSPRIPPLVTDIVTTAVASFDGLEFFVLACCPFCTGAVKGHDVKTKKFAVLQWGEGQRVITVRVKRFRCTSCGRLVYADEPFYPCTRIGSPVIDLFQVLATVMPPARAARIINALGIIVNRTTWKNYIGMTAGGTPWVDLYGLRLPQCLVTLSGIAAAPGGQGHPDPAAVLAACGYPSKSEKNTIT